MPKIDAKTAGRELEGGRAWPVYWVYGPERMKAREIVKRLRKAVVPDESLRSFSEDIFDGAETDAATVLDAARSLSLLGGGGPRLVLVREAHALKNPEALAELLGPAAPVAELPSVCVFLAKDLDGRKKFSKLLVEKAAVVACDDVADEERDAWVEYLARRRGLQLKPEQGAQLRALDPWSLDIIDQELEKLELSGGASDVMLTASAERGGADAFLDAFFSRNLPEALARSSRLADQPEESLPLLGLFAWNVRHLSILLAGGAGAPRGLNPYVAERLRRWARGGGRAWSAAETLVLQRRLFELDFGVKQTPLEPLGLWGSLVMEFCKAP